VPYIYARFSYSTNSYIYTTHTTNSILSVNDYEEPFGGMAVITIDNFDQALSALDLRGYQLDLGYGFVTPSDEYSNTRRLWVLSQRTVSVEGGLAVEFTCFDDWYKMAQSGLVSAGDVVVGTIVNGADFVPGETVTGQTSLNTATLVSVGEGFIQVINKSGSFTVGEIVAGAVGRCSGVVSQTAISAAAGGVWKENTTILAILTSILSTLTGIVGGVELDSDDTANTINTYQPLLYTPTAAPIRGIVRQLLQMSSCGARLENDDKLHVLYLDTAAVADYSYQTTHVFFAESKEQSIIIPNTVVFVDKMPDSNTAATYAGTANDAVSVARIGTVTTIEVDPTITSTGIATARATAWIAQRVAEANQGKIIAPMNVQQELYDMVQVTDARANLVTKGRVGRIDRKYDKRTGVYNVELQLGGIVSKLGQFGLNSLISDLNDLTTHTDPTEVTFAPDYSWDYTIPAAVQGYQHSITFAASAYRTVGVTAGTVKFYDGTTQSITHIATSPADATPAASCTLPDSTALYYVYFDLDNATPTRLLVTADYVSVMDEKTGLVCAVKGGSTADINAMVIPSRGKEPLITPDIIHMSGLVSYDFGGGKKIPTIYTTEVSAGHLKLTADTVKDGLWYSQSGVDISATTGINIYGTANALTTRATQAGTIQCYVGADGCIYAGAGAIRLDAAGLSMIGASGICTFYYDASTAVGLMYCSGVGAAKTWSILCKTDPTVHNMLIGSIGGIVTTRGNWLPGDTTEQLGDNTYPYYMVCAERLKAKTLIELSPTVSAPASPVEGMLYSDTDHSLYYHNGTAFVALSTGSGGIPDPGSETTGDLLVWDGSAWVSSLPAISSFSGAVDTVYHNTTGHAVMVETAVICQQISAANNFDGASFIILKKGPTNGVANTVSTVGIMVNTAASKVTTNDSIVDKFSIALFVPADWYYKFESYIAGDGQTPTFGTSVFLTTL